MTGVAADCLDFQLLDYRDVKGRFDRIVSVDMFEHVGVGHYDDVFRKCHELLDGDGVLVLHSIGRSDAPGFTNPWIAKYIFAGWWMGQMSGLFLASAILIGLIARPGEEQFVDAFVNGARDLLKEIAMIITYGVHSEVGNLWRVLVDRPGAALARLPPKQLPRAAVR